MAKSTIKTLPADLLEQLQEWLRDNSVTQAQATEMLNDLLIERGEETRSKSAVNRYSMQMAEIGERLQQSREMADMWMGKLGNEPQGKVGQLLNELVRNLAFNTSLKMGEGEGVANPKDIKDLAMSIEKLENATTINEKRKREIEKAMLVKAAESAEKAIVNSEAGLSKDTVKMIKNQILGIADD